MKKPVKAIKSAVALCLFVTVGTSQPTFSQGIATPGIGSFLILIETTADGFKMICEKGCAWKELSFDLNPYKPQAIDQWGMTSLDKHDKQEKDTSLANFLFTVKKTKESGVGLEAMEGTAWKLLSFRGPGNKSREYINAYGTLKPE